MIHSHSRAEKRERDCRKKVGLAVRNCDLRTAGRHHVWFAGLQVIYEYEKLVALHIDARSRSLARNFEQHLAAFRVLSLT